MDKKEKSNGIKFFVSWVIIIILLIICIITSFYTGKRFFEIANTQFGDKNSIVQAYPAKWHFECKIRVGEKVYEQEKNSNN